MTGHDEILDPELEDDLGAEFELRGDQQSAALDEAREEAATHLETAQRVQAEFENFRKRMIREQTDAMKRAGERIVLSLLPVVDNLERALGHAVEQGTGEEFLNGVEMVLGQMRDILAKEGVEVLDPLGAQFDVNLHQAVGQKEDLEVRDGTVVEVYQKGYAMHDRVIRSAMVVVATGGPSPEE